jgi:hypothetical protein
MPGCVYAPMYPMKAAGMHPAAYRVAAHSSRSQLRDRHHAVLALRDPRDQPIACGGFLVHMTNKPPQREILPHG